MLLRINHTLNELMSVMQEREYFELDISYQKECTHKCNGTMKFTVDPDIKVKTYKFDTYIPRFMQDVMSGRSREYNRGVFREWFDDQFEGGNDFFGFNKYFCNEHKNCTSYPLNNILSVKLSFPYGNIEERRLVVFMLGMDKKYGRESSINRCFNSWLGDKNIIGLIKEYL